MIRENLRLTILGVLLITVSVHAQVETEGEVPVAEVTPGAGVVPDKPIVPEEIAESAGLKPTAKPSPNRARQIGMIKQFENEITRVLEMDEDQATEVNEIFKDFIEGLSEEAEDRREARRENAEIIRELVDEMREAQRERDMETVREIREEISELRGEHARGKESIETEDFFEQIREVLTEDQIENFDPLADRLSKRLAGPQKPAQSKIRVFQKATNSMNLPADQLATIRQLLAEFSRENRNVRGPEAEEAEAELFESILEELDDDQASEFVQKVDEFEMMQKRGRGDRRANRKRRAEAREMADASDEQHGEEPDEVEVEEAQEESADEDQEEVEDF